MEGSAAITVLGTERSGAAGPGAGAGAGAGQQFSRHAQAHGWPHRTAFP